MLHYRNAKNGYTGMSYTEMCPSDFSHGDTRPRDFGHGDTRQKNNQNTKKMDDKVAVELVNFIHHLIFFKFKF